MRLDPDLAWGYVTSGGTESNLYGLYLAREMFPNGIFYFSEETHYSVLKNLRVLNARYVMIKRQEDGEIDYQDLHDMIQVNRDLPAVIIANIGTTMRGAIDNIERIKGILHDLQVVDTYIHADAALSGMILPFVAEPQPYGFDAGINSIAVSGPKLMGAPMPCGVILNHRTNVERVGRTIELVGIQDTTLSGSRNGLTPLMLWYALEQYGDEGFRKAGRGNAGHGGIRGGGVQPAWHSGLAPPELGHGGLPQARAGGLQEVADRPGGPGCPHHHHAPCHPQANRRAHRRLHPLTTTHILNNPRSIPMDRINRITRIVVMADNQVGVIADITAVLANAGINLESINTEANSEHEAVVLTTDNSDHALYVLNQAGYKAVGDEVLVLRLRDEPGALAKVAENLKQAGVNIQSMHILNRHGGYAMIALTTNDRARTLDAIRSDTIV